MRTMLMMTFHIVCSLGNLICWCICLQIVLGLLLERGDYVITEEHTYPHMIDSVTGPRGYKLWGVRYDDEGIIPAELEKVG